MADVQGYEVSDPRITILYQQPLAANGSSLPPLPPSYPGQGAALVMLLIAATLLVAGFGFAVFLQRKRRGSMASTIEDGLSLPSVAAKTSSSTEVDSLLPSSPDDDDGVFLSEPSQIPLANEPGRIEPSPLSLIHI